MNPGTVISSHYNGQSNFMTPDLVEYGWIYQNRVAYELSTGTFGPDRIWGVTVVKVGQAKNDRDDRSAGGFHSERDARRYIQSLMSLEDQKP